MRGLTITQPWAEAVASGIKEWETRSWRTAYRGPVAIHAAKGFPRDAREFAEVERALGRMPTRIAVGAIIAVADLTSIRPAEEVALEVSAIERLYGDYTPGRWAWHLKNVRRLPEPIGYRGALGLWMLDADTIAQMRGEAR
ncbi:MAG: ASCH domain-containing protein [Dehalococcoidia bacterium]|nr:ASCH domain-containing protein [Dehalococcoidia bacterium]